MNENIVAALHCLWRADGELTSSEVAKRVFEPEGDSELRNADRKIRHYFTESFPHLTTVDASGEAKKFSVDREKVTFGVGNVTVTNAEEEVTVGLGTVLLHRTEEGYVEVKNVSVGDGGADSSPLKPGS